MVSADETGGGRRDGDGGAAAGAPGSRVVDILAEGVEGSWTPATHLKIIKVGGTARCCVRGHTAVAAALVSRLDVAAWR